MTRTRHQIATDGTVVTLTNSGAPIRSVTTVNGTNQTLLLTGALGNPIDTVGPSVTSVIHGYWMTVNAGLVSAASTGDVQVTVSDTQDTAPGQTSALQSSLTSGGSNAEITTNKQIPAVSSDTLVINSLQTLDAGTVYKVGYFNLSAVPATATQPIVSALWKLGIGAVAGVLQTTIMFGTISTGGTGIPFQPIIPATDARPSILAPKSGTVQVVINRLDTGSWPALGLVCGFHAIFVPSAF